MSTERTTSSAKEAPPRANTPTQRPKYPLPRLRQYHTVAKTFEVWTITYNLGYGPREVIRCLKREATKHASNYGFFPDTGLSRTSENEIDEFTNHTLIVAGDLFAGDHTSTFGCLNPENWKGNGKEPFFVQPCRFGDMLYALREDQAICERKMLYKNDPRTRDDHRMVYDKIRQWDEEQRRKWARKFPIETNVKTSA